MKKYYFILILPILKISLLSTVGNAKQITITRPTKNIAITGIGTFINNKDIITSFSAIQNCKNVSIITNNKFYQTKILSTIDVSNGNLALLRANIDNEYFSTIRNDSLENNQAVKIITLDQNSRTFQAIPAKINYIGKYSYNIDFKDNEVTKGNSGSPIYNEKGYLIGIISGSTKSDNEAELINGISAKTIIEFAQKNNITLKKDYSYNRDLTLNYNFFNNFAVNIVCVNKNQNFQQTRSGSFGTGVFINETDVITNAHVIKDCQEINIFDQNKTYKGNKIAILEEKQGDLAFIRTNANNQNFAIIQDDELFKNKKIILALYTKKLGIFRKKITYIENYGHKNHGLEIILDNPQDQNRLIFGAPIIDEFGNLLGILALNLDYNSQQKLLIATPPTTIEAFALKSSSPFYKESSSNQILTDINSNKMAQIICSQD